MIVDFIDSLYSKRFTTLQPIFFVRTTIGEMVGGKKKKKIFERWKSIDFRSRVRNLARSKIGINFKLVQGGRVVRNVEIEIGEEMIIDDRFEIKINSYSEEGNCFHFSRNCNFKFVFEEN